MNFRTLERGLQYYSEMAAHGRVALYGEGMDNAFKYEWRPHLAWLAGQRRWGRLVQDVGKFLLHHKRVPLLSTVPRMIRDRSNRGQWEHVFPSWLDPGLVERLQLRDRWCAFHSATPSLHPVRPGAHSSFLRNGWPSLFEGFEPSYTGASLEVRHPCVDIRLLRFLLSLPGLPWCRNKHLLRCALRGVVPEPVRRRPKSPLQNIRIMNAPACTECRQCSPDRG